MPHIGILHTGLRKDEKMIVDATKEKGVETTLIDLRKKVLDPLDIDYWKQFDAILERCISTVRGNAAIEFLTNLGVNIINNKQVMNICSDKFQTASVLEANNVPTIKSILVFGEEEAKQAVESLGGYPAVIKSREGSWGRLMGKVNDDEALEAVMDHRNYLGTQHQATLIQEYINKPSGRDIRAFVVGGETLCAIYRESEHWITNTARGGKASNCPVTEEMKELCKGASDAVGGGILAMDIFETEDGLEINEINHTMEFKNSEEPTGVSISGAIVDYCVKS